MSVIREHLKKRVLEATSSKYSAGLTSLRLQKDRRVTLKLPLASWQDSIPKDKVSSVLQMKPDRAFSHVSYSEDDDSLVFTLNERNFISDILLDEAKDPPCRDNPQKLVVDFSSPNIAKPFHMGHLRSTIVGQFVANVLGTHHDVTRLNYLGDWGTQFGFVQKGLELLTVSDKEFRADPIGVLYKAYITSYNTPSMIDEARNIFTKLEKGEDAYMNEWEKIKTATLENLRKTYESLGIKFDEFNFESDYRASQIQPVIQDLLAKNLARLDNEQLIADINGVKVPLLRQNNTTLYITRDIAAALDRIRRFRCDKILYVVDKSQSQHFRNLDSILDRLGHQGVVQFCPFGRITGMSTRKGTSVFLSDILEESVAKMAEQQKTSENTRATDEDTTRILGLTGLQLYILKHGRVRDFSFDWSQALQATGDSGVKVQYTHSRLCSLEERFSFDPSSVQSLDDRSLDDPTVLPLVVEIARVDEVIRDAVEDLESSHIVSHLFKLCNLTSRALKNVQVKGQEPTVAQHRLLLFQKARSKIKICMELLGLKPLNKM